MVGENSPELFAPGNDQFRLVPVFGSGITRGTISCVVSRSNTVSWRCKYCAILFVYARLSAAGRSTRVLFIDRKRRYGAYRH